MGYVIEKLKIEEILSAKGGSGKKSDVLTMTCKTSSESRSQYDKWA